MDGLKYILREIETRRTLLHDFVKGIETSSEFTLFSGGIPDFIKDGELIYRPNTEDEPYESLTVEVFNDLYKKQFRNLRQWSRLSVPLKPGDSLPSNYEINEVLAYELGGGHCTAYFLMQLWSPSLQQPDRWFYVYVEHRHIPKQRYPEKTDKGVIITRGVYLYDWWKKDARKARPRLKPVDSRADIGGAAYWVEEDKIFTSPIIVIDEDTTEEQIWGQLLYYAWGHGYFNNLGETEAFRELTGYFGIKFDEKLETYRDTTRLNSIIKYLGEHTFSPYDARSNLAYVKRLSKVFGVEIGREERDLSPLPKSIPWAHQETGIPIRTIYHLVREGKLKKAADSSKKGTDAGDIIILSDDAVEKLKQLATLKEKRKAIKELAKDKGKSDEAIKRWLQRHRDLPEDKFNRQLSLWLGVRQPQSSKGMLTAIITKAYAMGSQLRQ